MWSFEHPPAPAAGKRGCSGVLALSFALRRFGSRMISYDARATRILCIRTTFERRKHAITSLYTLTSHVSCASSTAGRRSLNTMMVTSWRTVPSAIFWYVHMFLMDTHGAGCELNCLASAAHWQDVLISTAVLSRCAQVAFKRSSVASLLRPEGSLGTLSASFPASMGRDPWKFEGLKSLGPQVHGSLGPQVLLSGVDFLCDGRVININRSCPRPGFAIISSEGVNGLLRDIFQFVRRSVGVGFVSHFGSDKHYQPIWQILSMGLS